ncbi:Pumilio-family RNA binding repeat protein [Metarhizium brunneum]
MVSSESRGSPPQRTGSIPVITFQEEPMSTSGDRPSPVSQAGDNTPFTTGQKNITVLATSKLVNQAVPKQSTTEGSSNTSDAYPMDKLLARLSEQQAVLSQQNEALKSGDDEGNMCQRLPGHTSSSNSLPITPATDGFSSTAPSTRPASATLEEARSDSDEVLRLKLQLAQAQNKISKLDQELSIRTIKGESEMQAINAARGMDTTARDNVWMATDDDHSDTSEAMSTTTFTRTKGIWGTTKGSFAGNVLQGAAAEPQPGTWLGGRGFNQSFTDGSSSYQAMEGYRGDRLSPDPDLVMRQSATRRPNRYDHRASNSHHFASVGYNPVNGPMAQFEAIGGPMASANMHPPPGLGAMGMGAYAGYQQQPVGTPLSPHASEFTSKTHWKNEGLPTEGPTYLPPTEPLNYRRLLDRNVTCNWKYIVDKIVCNNDQQASIFLQQKLKVGTPDQKYDIVEAIVAQAYPLMVNRFGNFLVQRCFEHGTPEQVINIARAIRGNTLNLSMDPFGCHVVQKAFDSVPEEYKAIMVHELLRRIPETVIHRYACHVWQKLFELRWTESPPQIMKYVNEALRGMWHEVALGETGSLVVQNIFENCLEEDKRPCIEEVLANIDIVAHGQFGNWCIQHICEHGAPPDRGRAVDHVIRYAAEYSTDQFASKVVEKCLKIGNSEFLGRYLDRVCEGRLDRTRIPLIDIASDQYGNYLVQWILNNATPQHREMVAAHIRKHMVSLRGSKFGSRVGMLCTNHAVTTRPGPGVGPGMGSRMGPGPRFAGAYR